MMVLDGGFLWLISQFHKNRLFPNWLNEFQLFKEQSALPTELIVKLT